MYIFFAILSMLFWPALIIGIIAYFMRRRRGSSHPKDDAEWYLQFAFSREDAVSQLFLLLAFFFLGVTLLSLNSDMGDPASWQTILFITSAVGIVGAYVLRTVYTLAFSLVGLTGWWVAEAATWIDGKDIKVSALFSGCMLIALLLYTVGHIHEKDIKLKRFSAVYLVFGIMAVTFALFLFSTKPGIGIIASMTKGNSILGSWQLIVSLVVFSLALIGAALYAASQRLLSVVELLVVFALFLLFVSTVFLPPQVVFERGVRSYDIFSSGGALSSTGVLWAVVYNIAIFLELLGLILSGYVRRETWLVNIGALFLFLLIVVKYFDWFFTFLDKSLFFIGAGILLFVVGWFMERGRRYMIANIKGRASLTQAQ
ncbi:MAG: hypothetical protein AAB343_04100 [Patescibacteria group bacterium]